MRPPVAMASAWAPRANTTTSLPARARRAAIRLPTAPAPKIAMRIPPPHLSSGFLVVERRRRRKKIAGAPQESAHPAVTLAAGAGVASLSQHAIAGRRKLHDDPAYATPVRYERWARPDSGRRAGPSAR